MRVITAAIPNVDLVSRDIAREALRVYVLGMLKSIFQWVVEAEAEEVRVELDQLGCWGHIAIQMQLGGGEEEGDPTLDVVRLEIVARHGIDDDFGFTTDELIEAMGGGYVRAGDEYPRPEMEYGSTDIFVKTA